MTMAMKNQGNFTIAVGIPFTQASVTGFLGGFVFGMGDTILHVTNTPVQTALFSSAVVTMGAWLHFRSKWQEALNRSLGVPEKPIESEKKEQSVPIIPVRVELRDENNGYLRVDWLDLPKDLDELRVIDACDKVANQGSGFTHASLSGKGKVFSRSEFELLRDFFISHGWARWNNLHAHNQGASLTPAGRAIVRRIGAQKEKLDSPTPLSGLRLTQKQ